MKRITDGPVEVVYSTRRRGRDTYQAGARDCNSSPGISVSWVVTLQALYPHPLPGTNSVNILGRPGNTLLLLVYVVIVIIVKTLIAVGYHEVHVHQ